VHATRARIAFACVWSLLALAPIAGCHVGSADGTETDGPSPDAASGGDDDGAEVDASAGAPTVCTDIVSNVTDTGHHPRTYDFQQGAPGCISPSCHDGSSAGPTYTVAGAVYTKQVLDGEPVAGSHIYVTDKNGVVVEMTTAQNGFFYTTEPLTPPFVTFVSGCPLRIPMAGPADGNCNRAGCHGANYKIYLSDVP
jgi:hypothetical protein